MAMARFFLLVVLLVAAALANEPSNQVVETRKVAEQKNEAQIKFSNATNDRFDQEAKIVDQVVETRKAAEEKNEALIKSSNATNDRLDQLAKTIFQIRFSAKCNLARSSKLELLTNGKRYFFSFPTLTNWTIANETCAKMGLHLATIRNLNEAQLVAAEGFRIQKEWAWWVSAKNHGSGSEKDLRWSDGTKLELDSPLWMDHADKKDCVRMYHISWGSKGKLNSNECIGIRPFICELPRECY